MHTGIVRDGRLFFFGQVDRCQAHLFRFFQHKVEGRIVFVRNHPVEDGVLDGTFQAADFTARLEVEHVHDFSSVYRRLEVPDTVFLFQILQFLAHQLEIVQEALLGGTPL